MGLRGDFPISPRRRVAWVSVAGAICALAIGAAWRLRAGAKQTDVTSEAPKFAFPAACRPFESLVLDGVVHAGKGVLITGEGACQITIRHSKLSGDVIVKTTGAVDVTIEDSNLDGERSALDVGAGTLSLRTTTLKSRGTGIKTEGAARVSLENSEIAADIGILAATGTVVDAMNSRVTAVSSGIDARDDVRVTANHLHVRGTPAVTAGSSFFFSVTASELDSPTTGITTGLNARVTLLGKTVVTAKRVGIRADENLAVTLGESKIDGGQRGVVVTTNANVSLSARSSLSGSVSALQSSSDVTLTLDDSTVESAGIAVCSIFDADITAHGSTIHGATAIQVKKQPRGLVLRDTRVEGAQVFDVGDCPLDAPTLATSDSEPTIPLLFPAPLASGAPVGSRRRFDYVIAKHELDKAQRTATTICNGPRRTAVLAIVEPGFLPDGRNANARIKNAIEVGVQGTCILHTFRAVRVPPFDPDEKISEIFRMVELK
jgi:hypothetical protein